MLRGPFIFREKKKKDLSQSEEKRRRREERSRGESKKESAGEKEDEETTFAGDDDGDGAAVRRDGKMAKAEAVEKGDWRRLLNGDFVISRDRREGRKIDPDEVAGFFFDGALEEDARFVGRPAKDAESDANTGDAIERGEIANFENLPVEEIGDFFAAGRDAQAAFVGVEGGKFLVVIGEEIEALEAIGAGHGAILLDSHEGNRSLNGGDIAEGAAIVRRFEGANINARGL